MLLEGAQIIGEVIKLGELGFGVVVAVGLYHLYINTAYV
jgi:hypothetical protein